MASLSSAARALAAPSSRDRVLTVEAGLRTLSYLLQDETLSAINSEGVSSLCELMAEELVKVASLLETDH